MQNETLRLMMEADPKIIDWLPTVKAIDQPLVKKTKFFDVPDNELDFWREYNAEMVMRLRNILDQRNGRIKYALAMKARGLEPEVPVLLPGQDPERDAVFARLEEAIADYGARLKYYNGLVVERELAGRKVKALHVEANAKVVRDNGNCGAFVITPAIDEDYWTYRVPLHEKQAVVAFPKFGTMGIGFQQEEDWNTNLPYTESPVRLWEHISHNRKYKSITRPLGIAAIKALQDVVIDNFKGENA